MTGRHCLAGAQAARALGARPFPDVVAPLLQHNQPLCLPEGAPQAVLLGHLAGRLVLLRRLRLLQHDIWRTASSDCSSDQLLAG